MWRDGAKRVWPFRGLRYYSDEKLETGKLETFSPFTCISQRLSASLWEITRQWAASDYVKTVLTIVVGLPMRGFLLCLALYLYFFSNSFIFLQDVCKVCTSVSHLLYYACMASVLYWIICMSWTVDQGWDLTTHQYYLWLQILMWEFIQIFGLVYVVSLLGLQVTLELIRPCETEQYTH